jgi:hypothetical protein
MVRGIWNITPITNRKLFVDTKLFKNYVPYGSCDKKKFQAWDHNVRGIISLLTVNAVVATVLRHWNLWAADEALYQSTVSKNTKKCPLLEYLCEHKIELRPQCACEKNMHATSIMIPNTAKTYQLWCWGGGRGGWQEKRVRKKNKRKSLLGTAAIPI